MGTPIFSNCKKIVLAVTYELQSFDTRLSLEEIMDALQAKVRLPDEIAPIVGLWLKHFSRSNFEKDMSKRRKYFEYALLDAVENVDIKIPDAIFESVARSIRGRNSQHMDVESIECRRRQKRRIRARGHPTI